MNDIETTAIEKYLGLVKRATQARSKELRIDLADAVILSTEISAVLARLAKSSTPAATTAISADGGRF